MYTTIDATGFNRLAALQVVCTAGKHVLLIIH